MKSRFFCVRRTCVNQICSFLALCFLVCCLPCNISIAQDANQFSSQKYPCGVEGSLLSRITPQGWRGADFRKTCEQHDICYETLGANRSSCDKQFSEGLLSSCQNSRRPWQCKAVARIISKIVGKRGQRSFEKGQKIARQSSRG